MAERPIQFSSPTVRAILGGKKTQTRRVVFTGRESRPGFARGTWDCESWDAIGEAKLITNVTWTAETIAAQIRCPYGQPGDRLWVRETWRVVPCEHCDRDNRFVPCSCSSPPQYRADGGGDLGTFAPWRPSIHMARWASRITLEVTGVRVERLQEISEYDALAEGVSGWVYDPNCETARDGFRVLWDSINAKCGHGWVTDPWVWVVEFRVAEVKHG